MSDTYDIFEMVEGGPLWRAAVEGQVAAILRAEELAEELQNEVRVLRLPEKAVVAVVNPKATGGP